MQTTNIAIMVPNCFSWFNLIQNESTKALELLDANVFVIQTSTAKHQNRASIAEQFNCPLITLHCSKGYADTYADLYARVHKIYVDNDLNKLCIFNAFVFKQFTDECQVWHDFNKFKQSTESMRTLNFNSYLHYDMFVLYILMELQLPVYNFIEDPLQLKLSYVDKHNVTYAYFHDFDNAANIYKYKQSDSQHWHYQYNPSQQYPYAKALDFNLDNVKPNLDAKYLFILGMSRGWIHRARKVREPIIKSIHDFVEPNSPVYDSRFNFRFSCEFIRTHEKGSFFDLHKQKNLPYTEYMQLVKDSKFTMIVPSIDPRFFSLRRFFEAICAGCIPLIHKDCDYKAGFNYDPIMIQIIEMHLLTDPSKQLDFSRQLHVLEDIQSYLMNEIKDTNFMKNYFSKEFYVKHMHTFLDVA
jgi:hypothetical protein